MDEITEEVIALPSPTSILFRILLLVWRTGVMNVVTAQSAAQRRTIMPTFTIDNDNNITAHGTPEEAAAASATPFDSFSSQKELAGLVTGWPAERRREPACLLPSLFTSSPQGASARPRSRT